MPEISLEESKDPKDAQHLVYNILNGNCSIGKIAIAEESITKTEGGELITAWLLFDFPKNQTEEVFFKIIKKILSDIEKDSDNYIFFETIKMFDRKEGKTFLFFADRETPEVKNLRR